MTFAKDPLNATIPREIIEYSQDLEDRVEGGFNSLTKDDVGLGKVINEVQASIIHRSTTNTNVEIQLPAKNAQYLLISSWAGQSSGGLWILAVRGDDLYISEIKSGDGITMSSSGRTLQINKSTYRFITLIDIY